MVSRAMPPIHLNTEAKMPLRSQFRKMANLSQRPGNELLPAKARIHRHHQNITTMSRMSVSVPTGVAG